MSLRTNHKIELARELILNTRANIFLTGRAGTGKTTFLRGVLEGIGKRAVVAAPTGVAALNAGGVTLHSLFQLPFAPFIPGMKFSSRQPRRISKSRLALVRSIELLVIDEVSMVRADVMDAIDDTLRTIRRSAKPFGGVQLLLIGDIHQLSPICRDEEWEMLREHYATQFFFDSHALRKAPYITVEFDEIFRQSDPHFMKILNAVRENVLTPEILEELNRRYIPEFEPSEDEEYITLTTHNNTANGINSRKLKSLKSQPRQFAAQTTGDFQQSAFPNDQSLELKVGAQVLFIKNDVTGQRRYYNGLIGRVTMMDERSVTVQPRSGGDEIRVEAVQWENLDYKVNGQGEMEQVVKGTFSQIPLKCAWAITIHKSQGLSFDRAIIDASGSFAHGQVYVALSRCRSIAGMVLRTPISRYSVIGDQRVDSFCDYVSNNQPSEELIASLRRDAYCSILCEIFEYNILQRLLWDLMSDLSGATGRAYPKLMSSMMELMNTFERDIVKVGESFQKQLRVAIHSDEKYESSEYISERLRQASGYFAPRLESLQVILRQLSAVSPDSVETKRKLTEHTTMLRQMVMLNSAELQLCKDGFTTDKYHRERARIIAQQAQGDGVTESKSGRKSAKAASVSQVPDKSELQGKESTKRGAVIDAPEDITHVELYETLAAWRLEEAQDRRVPPYCILSNRTLLAIQGSLPTSDKKLERVIGMGKVKMSNYSQQILDIVSDYCFNNNIDPK